MCIIKQQYIEEFKKHQGNMKAYWMEERKNKLKKLMTQWKQHTIYACYHGNKITTVTLVYVIHDDEIDIKDLKEEHIHLYGESKTKGVLIGYTSFEEMIKAEEQSSKQSQKKMFKKIETLKAQISQSIDRYMLFMDAVLKYKQKHLSPKQLEDDKV